MTINVNCPPRGLFIGRETENVARTLAVDFSAWAAEHGPGTLQVLLQRPGDSAPYPVTLTVEGTVATWKPSETDLAEAGTGAVQLVYTTAAGVREKTQIIPVMVEPSLGVESDPPEGWTSWLDQLTDLAAETEQHAIDAAESAENAGDSATDAQRYATDAGDAKNAAVAAAEAAAASASHYPQIVNGVWYVWSPSAGAYISTGIDAQGEDGVSPTVEITAIQGGHRVVITDAEGSHTFDVMDGVTPDLSAYRTAADQDEIDDAQDEELNNLKSAFEAHEQYAEETYAKQDGTYEDLTAGNAYELLSDRGDTNQQPYLFRQTGGDSNAYNREQLKKIVGGTVAFNQLCRAMRATSSEKGLTFTRNDDGFLTISGTITEAFNYNYITFTSYEVNVKRDGTKYLFLLNKPIPYAWGLGGFGGTIPANTSAGMWTNTAGGNWTNGLIFRAMVGDTVDISGLKASVIDLTQMFGTTIADYIYSLETASAGAGVAFFRSMFPADYYDYNPGELKSVEGVSAHETVGFNQWDEEWEVGTLIRGNPVSSNNQIRSKNFCKCLGNTSYYLRTSKTDGGNQNVYYAALNWYDSDKNFISFNYSNNRATTSPKNAAYFKICTNSSTVVYGNTYNHDICINISDPKRNGTYEPYKKRTYPLDSSLTLRGIPKLDSNNRLYYDGDTYESDGTVTRKYGIVDLGTLSWMKASENTSRKVFSAYISDIITISGSTVLPNLITPKFTAVTIGKSWEPGDISMQSQNVKLLACITGANDYADASAFKAAMSGVMLVYELDTPTTETAEPYRELEICDRDGTEEFVSTSIAPVGHETFYPVNVFDYIDRLTEPDADMIADSAIAANKYFSVGNRLFLSTASIAAGAQIIPGTNCTETSLAAALNALNA